MRTKNIILGLLLMGGLVGCTEGTASFEDGYDGRESAQAWEDGLGTIPSDEEDYSSWGTTLAVEFESIRGTVRGEGLAPDIILSDYGEMLGRSAHFALSSGTEPPGRYPEETSTEEQGLTVTLDVCPIEGIVDIGPVNATRVAWATMTLCENGWCRSANDGQLELEVIDTNEGLRVIAHATWDADNEVFVQLRYLNTADPIE